MDVFRTHGAFSWSELMTPDPKAATAFYGELFGWTVSTEKMPDGDYHLLKVGETSVGGMMGMPPGKGPMPPMWGSYVTVDDVDATARRCTELGGKVLVPPTDIPSVGRFAMLQDPQGATISAITYAMA